MKNLIWVVLIGLNIFLTLSLMFPKVVVAPNSKGTFLDQKIIYEYINDYRKSNGASILTESTLCEYAKERSEEITTDFSHVKFRQDSKEKLFTEVCPKCRFIGENLARGQEYNEKLLSDWKNSPKHNESLLDPDWEIMCVATTWVNNIPYTALEFGDIK